MKNEIYLQEKINNITYNKYNQIRHSFPPVGLEKN